MKIIICCPDRKDNFGGPFEWIKRFAVELRDLGHDVIPLFFVLNSPKLCPTLNYLKDKGFACKYLKMQTFTQYTDNTEDRVKWILKQVKDISPDIYIGHNTFISLLAGKWIKSAGIPNIMVLHSDDPKHKYFYSNFINGFKEFSVSGIVAVSEMLLETVRINNPYKIPATSIPCGVPIPIEKASFNGKELRLLYLGKLSEYQKRIIDTTKALCKTTIAIEGCNAEIYGMGSEENKVKNIISENPLARVSYKGFIKNSDIGNVLLKNNVFVLLSDFEGTPVALMEAMAAGLVPVCYNIQSGIPELVKHMETGLIVNDRDVDFLNAIKLLNENKDLWKKLSDNAKEKVRAEYSINSTTEKWAKFMEGLLIESNPKREIEIPENLQLPPYDPEFSSIDRRKKSNMEYIKSQIKRIKNTVKKNL
jgi:colanic acid/amylovoran biosynthesis glycosyltransferase